MLLSRITMILCNLCNRSLAFLFERMLCLYAFEFFRRVQLPWKISCWTTGSKVLVPDLWPQGRCGSSDHKWTGIISQFFLYLIQHMQMMDVMNINTGENENANRCWLQYEVSSLEPRYILILSVLLTFLRTWCRSSSKKTAIILSKKTFPCWNMWSMRSELNRLKSWWTRSSGVTQSQMIWPGICFPYVFLLRTKTISVQIWSISFIHTNTAAM